MIETTTGQTIQCDMCGEEAATERGRVPDGWREWGGHHACPRCQACVHQDVQGMFDSREVGHDILVELIRRAAEDVYRTMVRNETEARLRLSKQDRLKAARRHAAGPARLAPLGPDDGEPSTNGE